MTARAEIGAIVILAICPCGTIHADEIDMEQDDFGAWKTTDEERFILCDECGQLFDAALDPAAIEALISAAEQRGREAGLREAARIVEKRADDYSNEFGSYDHSTGVTEYPGNGSDWMEEWEEIALAILALITKEASHDRA